ncbi:hypothetical protein AVEN_193962-1 [Araneus ventricosus]|uniref:Uncharacterized protein n=1 Tax=Araneus ventricosus TaxID=182803 RepID=A0A4Y2MD57_ARAVE|nr:hypothetical protein AVEN_193962-1 [Araneus ventricosus]
MQREIIAIVEKFNLEILMSLPISDVSEFRKLRFPNDVRVTVHPTGSVVVMVSGTGHGAAFCHSYREHDTSKAEFISRMTFGIGLETKIVDFYKNLDEIRFLRTLFV